MQKEYHFGVPATLVWSIHILFGLFLLYLGYLAIEQKPINKWIGILLAITGVIMILYHAHIWLVEANTIPA